MQLMKSTMLGYINKLLLLAPFFVFGNFQDSIQIIDLQNVVVKSTKINTIQKQAPLSVTLKSFTEDKNFSSQSSFSDFIKNTPGVFTTSSNNFSQDMRISIRGFGARSAFGIRGIKLIVDGIPETTPDGQGQIDNLPLSLIDNIEVIRGPSSSIYGNASGGVIFISTFDSIKGGSPQFRSTFGSYGMKRLSFDARIKGKKTLAIFHQNFIKQNGFREHSKYSQSVFNLKVRHKLSQNTKTMHVFF